MQIKEIGDSIDGGQRTADHGGDPKNDWYVYKNNICFEDVFLK